MKKKVKLVYNSFKPMNGSYNFFYKPSVNNNIIVYCSAQYGNYLEKIYGSFPSRLNPVVLRIEDENGTMVNDLLIDRFNTNLLEKILDAGGECFIEMEYNQKVLLPKLYQGSVLLSL